MPDRVTTWPDGRSLSVMA